MAQHNDTVGVRIYSKNMWIFYNLTPLGSPWPLHTWVCACHLQGWIQKHSVLQQGTTWVYEQLGKNIMIIIIIVIITILIIT